MIVGSPTILNLVPGGVNKVVHVNQVNDNIEIQFQIMNGSQPYNVTEGVSCTIRGTKGDSYGYTAEAATTVGSNVVTVTLTEQLTAVAGGCNVFELVFVGAENSMKVSTENFILAVERAALGEDTVISDSDLAYAAQVLDQLQSVGAVNAQVQQNKANIAAEVTRATAAEQTLQQNINSEASARQSADNTLQSNINVEASARATQDNVLQAEIDQLVAPSGSAPSAAEVTNARIGADGTTYDTLGNAIRGQVTDVKSAIEEIEIEHYDHATGVNVNLDSYKHEGKYVELNAATGATAYSVISNTAYKYYEIPTEGLRNIRVTGLNLQKVKPVVFANASNNLIDYYPKEHSSTKRVDTINCIVPDGATKVIINGEKATECVLNRMVESFTMDAALKDALNAPNDIAELSNVINGIEIEDYILDEWEDVTANATLHTGAYAEVTASNTFNIFTNSAYKYLEYDITDETKFRTKGFADFGIKPAIFVNANGDILAYEPPNRNHDQLYTTVIVDVPNGATKLYVDGRKADIISIEKYIGLKFKKEDTDSAVVLTKKDNDIQIRAELTSDTDIAIRGNLFGSPNKTFIWSQYHMIVPHDLSYTNITDGTNWKMSADDIAPVHFNYSYRGAGHGDDRTKLITCASSHGLTESNIGELWKDSNNVDWMILKVPTTTTVVIGRPSDGSSYFKGFESGNPVSPLSKDGVSVAFTSYSQYLLTPAVNHVSEEVYVDNKQVTANGVYKGDTVDIVESYDIVYIPAMLNYLADNVGSNTNLSLCDDSIEEAYCTVNNVYHYTEHGACTLFQGVDFHKQVKFEYYGGVQSQPIGNFMNVPKSVSWQAISEQPASDRVLAPAEWADADNPPTRFYQYDAVNWTKGFVLGINNDIADGLPNVRKNVNNAGTFYRSRKVYPYFKTDENPMAEGTVISAVTYRIPLVPYNDTDIPNVAWYYVNNDIYLLIDVQKSVDKYLALPEKMIGKKIEVVESAGSITIPYSFVGAKGIKINTVDYGSAILKLT